MITVPSYVTVYVSSQQNKLTKYHFKGRQWEKKKSILYCKYIKKIVWNNRFDTSQEF